MNGKDILQILFDTDYQIISNLISSKILNRKSKYPRYIVQCFDKFCSDQSMIKINLKSLYNFSNDFCSIKCPNLLLFDNLCILFKKCQVIHCGSTGVINALYLSSLLKILGHINQNENDNKKKKLNKIILNDVTTIKLSDSEFLKYKSLINEKAQWILEQTDDSILTLTKCVFDDYL